MRIYKVSQNVDTGYYIYDSFLVACESEEAARNTHPDDISYPKDGKWVTINVLEDGTEYQTYLRGGGRTWVDAKDLDKVFVEEIGTANEGITGVICSSFNAG